MNFNENKLEEQTTNPYSVPKKKNKFKPRLIEIPLNIPQPITNTTPTTQKSIQTKQINQRINLNQLINPQIWICENDHKNQPKNQPTNSDLQSCRSTSTHRAPVTTAPTWETTTPIAKIYPKIITNLVTISQIKLNPSPTYKANKYQHKPTKINLQTPRLANTNSDIHYHQIATKT